MDIEERLGQLIDEQHGVTVMLSQKARNRYIQRRDALRNEIAADWRAMVEALEQLTTWMAYDEGPLFALWENADIGSFENHDLEWEETLQMIHDGKGVGGYGDPLPVAYYRQARAALARVKGE